MPIVVTCSCGKPIKAPDAAAGKKVRCPHCQRVLSVPAPPDPGSDKSGSRAVPSATPAADGKAAGNMALLSIGAVGSIGVLVAVVWFSARSLNTETPARAPEVAKLPAPPATPPVPETGPTEAPNLPAEDSTPPENEKGAERRQATKRVPRGMPPGAVPPGFPGGPGGPFGGMGGPGSPGGPFPGPAPPPKEPAQPPDPTLPNYDGFWEGTAKVLEDARRRGGAPAPPMSVSVTIANNVVRAVNIRPAEEFSHFMPSHTEMPNGPTALEKDAEGRGSFVAHAAPGSGFAPPEVAVPRIVLEGTFVDATTATGKFQFEHPFDPQRSDWMPTYTWTMTRPAPAAAAPVAPAAPPDAPAPRPDPPVEPGERVAVEVKELDGTWRGTTAENAEIAFTIQKGAVTSIIIFYRVPGESITRVFNQQGRVCAIEANVPNPEFALSNDVTVSDQKNPGVETHLTLRVSGSFPSNTAVRGTIELRLEGRVANQVGWSAVLQDRSTKMLDIDDSAAPNDPERRKKAKPEGLQPNAPGKPLAGSVIELLAAIEDTSALRNADGNIDRLDAFIAIASSRVPSAAQKVKDEDRQQEAIGPVLERWRMTKRGGGPQVLIHIHAVQAMERLDDAALEALPELEEALKDKGYNYKEGLKSLVVSLRKRDKANKTRAKTEARKAEIEQKAEEVEEKAEDGAAAVAAPEVKEAEEKVEAGGADTHENQAAAKLGQVKLFLDKRDEVQARKYCKQILERFPETSAAKEAREILDEIGEE